MKNISFCLLLILLFTTRISFAQNDKTILLKQVITSVDSFQHRFSPEKVYLHTDRAYYFTGDTIWFKAYLFDRLNLSAATKSRLLYVELNDDSLTNVKRLSIPISYGIGWAQIPLIAKQFHEGTYTLRAYTNWMQNLSEDGFFKQRIYIGKPSDDTWLIHADNHLAAKDKLEQLNVKLNVTRYNKEPVALHDVQVIVKDQDQIILRKDLQTSSTGEVTFAFNPADKLRSGNLSLYLLNTQKGERGKLQSIPLLFNRPERIDLQFFPEGGNWVGGINTTIAFKAINEDGLGADVSGTIYDSKNSKVVGFKSLHNGMGSFEITPVTGEKYTAQIDNPTGSSITYSLPEIKDEGTALHVNNPEKGDSLTVKLSFSSNIKKSGTYSLIGESRGFISYARIVLPENASFSIAKNIFPTGIVHFSLLKDTLPVNERIAFIDNNDNFKISITSGQPFYSPKDSVTLNLDVKDSEGNPVKGGSFSLAVTDDSRINADTAGNNNIITALQLKADLKGYIENPSFYFRSARADRWIALDNLLLTQGWIGLNWATVFKSSPPKYKAEQSFVITGKAVNAFKKPVEGAQILVSSQKPAFITETVTQKNGVYVFDKLPLLDTASFLIMAHTAKGKIAHYGQITVDKFTPAEIPAVVWPQVQPWFVNTDSITQTAANTNIARFKDDPSYLKGRVLKEVVIKGKKIIPNSYNINGSGNADMVFDEKDIKAAGVTSLYDFLKQQLPGFKVIMKDGFTAVMFDKYYVNIRVDGVPLPLDVDGPVPTVQQVTEALRDNAATAFIGVEVMYSKNYTRDHAVGFQQYDPKKGINKLRRDATKGYGYDRDSSSDNYLGWRADLAYAKDNDMATIELTTRLKTGQDRNYNGSLNKVTYRPVYTVYARKFYNPKYEPSQENTPPYPRTTIYWIPDIITDNEGKAKITFNAGNKPGSYSVILQGADLVNGLGAKYIKVVVK